MQNKTGIIIQARMGSTRLPGKVLLDLNGKKVLEHVVDRCRKAKVDEVIVATTTNKIDDAIFDFCKKKKIKCYRGSDNNVLDRYYQCAKKFKLKFVLRVTSDCPLVDWTIINKLIDKYFGDNFNYCRIDTDTFPRGFDCEIFSFQDLKKSFENSTDNDEREHVTIYMRRNPQEFVPGLLVNEEDLSYMRLTLDTNSDYELLKIVFENVKKLDFIGVIAYLKDHKKLLEINQDVEQKKVNINDGSKKKIHVKDGFFLVKDEHEFWRMEPSPPSTFLTDFYKNQYADDLEKLNVEDKIKTLESFVKNKTVMDIGCGDGELLKKFKKNNWSVSGIEPSKNLKFQNDLNIINEDFEKIKKFEKKDAVVLNYVLEHHPDPINFLKKIKREVLKSGGILLIEVPNDFNELQLVCEKACDSGKYWIKFPDHLNYFTFKSLRKLLEILDFDVVYQEASFPLELFILMGEDYIKNKKLGKKIHAKRVLFETNMIKAGKNQLKRDIYSKLSELNIGRSIIMYAKNK